MANRHTNPRVRVSATRWTGASWKIVAGLIGVAAALSICFIAMTSSRTAVAAPARPAALKAPQAFAGIADPAARSRAIFTEAGKVILHARCVNCHPAGDTPSQKSGQPHLPAVVRGADGFGAIGLRCYTCHQAENYEASKVPGAPNWHLAPLEMAWQGRTLAQICEQLKDPKRNGGKTLEQLHEHFAHDPLVGWGWNPGAAREPAPGTQQQLGELIQAWIQTGAECPKP